MIVACEKCHTRFQLDDARVPEAGVRVRCSRCKHAFFATRAGASPDDVTHALAHAAASNGGANAPEATQDLSAAASADGDTLGDISGATRALEGRVGADLGETTRYAKGPNGRSATREADDESDWQFNDERPPTTAGGRGARGGAARAEARAPSEPSVEELGSPESWDFLASGDSPPSVGAADASTAVHEEAAAKPPAPRAGATVGPERRAPAAPAALRPIAEATALRLSGVVHAAGWIASGLLLAAIAAAGFAPRAEPALVLPSASSAGNLAFEGLTARLVDNAVAGPVLVVSGRLRNPTSAPAALGATLEVTLMGDGSSAPQLHAAAPALAGLKVPDEDLRERDAENVRAEIAASAAGLAWTELAPGEEIALEALLPEVPLGARAFSVAVRPAEPPPPPPPVEIVVPEPAPPPPPPVARERRGRAKRGA